MDIHRMLQMGPLRSEEEDFGLLAMLDKKIDGKEEEKKPDLPDEDENELPKRGFEEDEEEQEPKPEEKEELDTGFEDMEFPGLGAKEIASPEPEAEKKSFDEKAFDSETAAILSKIEEKGHPGEVYKELRSELKEARMKLSSAPDSELETLRQENQRLKETEDRLKGMEDRIREVTSRNAQLQVEELPEFKEKVEAPIREIQQTLQVMAESTGMDVAQLEEIVSNTSFKDQDAALDAIEEKVGRRNVSRLERMIDDYRGAARIRKEMMEDASARVEAAKARELEEGQRVKEERAERFRTALKASYDRFSKAIPGYVDANGGLSGTASEFRRKGLSIDIESLTESDLAWMVFATDAVPAMKKHIIELQQELRDLKVAARGNGGGGLGSNPGKRTADKGGGDEEESFMSRFKKQRF